MAIKGIFQPDILQIDAEIRLRKFDGHYDFAFEWYQDEETVYLVDGVKKPYDWETLTCMYEYLNQCGELYFIEIMKNGEYLTIGDVAFWASRRCFESVGFEVCGQMDKGKRFMMKL